MSVATVLHAASCQVKVFKPKGADRKHKTDREKMLKRGQTEQDKFQPSYDCTIFTECPHESLYSTANSPQSSSGPSTPMTPCQPFSPIHIKPRSPVLRELPEQEVIVSNVITNGTKDVEVASNERRTSVTVPVVINGALTALRSEASPMETTLWLQQNRLENYIRTFANFSGVDLLRLTRDEAIEICGLADGIRFYNALHSRTVRPRLILYVSRGADEVFRAIYLENLQENELSDKIAAILPTAGSKISRLCLIGPTNIKVLLTDDVVRNLSQETMFLVDFDKGKLA